MRQIFRLLLSFMGCGLVVATAHGMVPRFQSVPGVGELPSSTVRVITEDSHGFIWAGTNQGLFRYDGHQIRAHLGPPDAPIAALNSRINDLYFAANNLVWVATNDAGLVVYDQASQRVVDIEYFNGIKKFNRIQPALQDGSLWLGTDQGLFLVKGHESGMDAPTAFLSDHHIISLLELPDLLYIGTTEGLYVLDLTTEMVERASFSKPTQTITAMVEDAQNRLWASTRGGLFVKQADANDFTMVAKTELKWLSDMLLVDDQLWISTIGSGVLVYDLQTETIQQLLADQQRSGSLASDHVMTLFLDDKHTLWLGLFNAGMDVLPVEHLKFGLNMAAPNGYDCAPTSDVYAMSVQDQVTLIGGAGHITQYDQRTGRCQVAFLEGDTSNRTIIYGIQPMPDGDYLLATGTGIHVYQFEENRIRALSLFDQSKALFMVTLVESMNAYVVGADDGLWQLSADLSAVAKLPFENNEPFFGTAKDDQNQLFVGNFHLVKLNSGGYLKALFHEPGGLNSAAIDESGDVWVGSKKRGLLRWQKTGELSAVFEDHPKLQDANIMSVLVSQPDQVWASSNKGLIQYQPSTGLIIHHDSEQALQALQFHPNAAFLDHRGQMYFGGRGGYNQLAAEKFPMQQPAPPGVLLTALTQFNRPIWPGQSDCAVCIDQPIELLERLTLNHRNELVGFNWTTNDMGNARKVQFKSRLLGMFNEWSEAENSNQNVTFVRLPAGDYTLQIMASYDGIHWPDKPMSLAVTVSPPPWLSPWAFALYAVLLVATVMLIIHLRTRAAYQKAQELELKVEERTLELVDKNAVIEDLLRQKNALFANITHEFKTPLTLILGPINKLKKYLQSTTATESPHMSDVQMIDRNANRLLNMVGHLLKLSAAEDLENKQKVTVQAAVIAAMIMDSFRPLAESKGMRLLLDTDACPADVVITLAPESFEIILGNLISNAIKYCDRGAEIKVSLLANETDVTLRCEDNGPGIAVADQPLIFERFSRLQQHAHIEGNGIGLSVVKQLVEIHGGKLVLDSEVGRGTCFSITVPRSHEVVSQTEVDAVINSLTVDVGVEQNQVLTLDRLDGTGVDDEDDTKTTEAVQAKPELLIIEDNVDMQQYILSELTGQFNCHLASNGQLGVDACITIVPDIVISDVMMPVMDGYEVASQLRQDQRTSHIPIVLLTALNTTQSRIKGWQEHVDSYLTKPFDSEELLIKLHSILAIRKLLQAKNAQRFGDQVELDLPKIDNDFIQKLRRVIADNYTNPNLQRSHLASEMAISERQLLRKTKALINITPNDALRDYRLEQAVLVLQTGKSVNLVSDTCGFNSTSYFVRCFKAKFDITPKQYQKQLESQ